VRLRAPDWLLVGQAFRVGVTAEAAGGIHAIEIAFAGRVVRLDAGGLARVRRSVRLVAERVGLQRVSAVAVARDGTRGLVVSADIGVSTGDEVPGPDGIDELSALLAANPYGRRYGAPRPGRDPLYRPPGLAHRLGRALGRQPWWERPVPATPWWVRWQEDGGGQPFDWGAACGRGISGIDAGGQVLTCWLAQHPAVAQALVWRDIDLATGVITDRAYPDWTETEKILLNQAVYFAWSWLNGGLEAFLGEFLPDPPANQIPLTDCQRAMTGLTRDAAWKLYLGTVAHSLAVEIGGFVPWSIAGYVPSELETLFHARHFYREGDGGTANFDVATGGCRERVQFTGYVVDPYVIPAPPTTTFEFLVAQDVIQPDHHKTIVHLLDWARKHMRHIFVTQSGAESDATRNMEAFYQYRGNAPATRIMTGTTFQDPDNPSNTNGPWGWSPSGCHGVATFFRAVMRAANIPVKYTRVCKHAIPLFPTLAHCLSHGDDVYHQLAISPPLPPPQMLLVSYASFNSWIVELGCSQIGRRPADIAVQLLPDVLMDAYCADVAQGLGHAEGEVYEWLQYDYSLEALEDLQLWERLAHKAAQTGACNA
jgi:hypothetical protein